MRNKKVCILGAGIIGLWIARAFQAQGINPTVIGEHSWNSGVIPSDDLCRVFRVLDTSTELSLRAIESITAWRELERATRKKILLQRGCMIMGAANDSYLIQIKETANNSRFEYEEFANRAALQNYLPDVQAEYGIRDPQGGILMASIALEAIYKDVERTGARMIFGRAVPDFSKQLLHLENEEIPYDTLVLAGGVDMLLDFNLSLPIVVTRQDILYFEDCLANHWSAESIPPFGFIDEGFYGFPSIGGKGIRLASHLAGKIVRSKSKLATCSPPEAFVNQARDFLRKRFPLIAENKLCGHRLCHYDTTEDGHPIIKQIVPNCIVAAGFSGSGFKYAPSVGVEVAKLALGERE